MKENVHTVKVRDVILCNNHTNLFIMMDYVSNDLETILNQETFTGLSDFQAL